VSLFREPPALFFENACLVDPLGGETAGTLRLERGRIAALNGAPHRGDLRFDLEGSLVLPGLINAHDHLELDNFPRLKLRPCYPNASAWSREMDARLDRDPVIVAARAVPLADRLFLGCLKNLLAGVTTVAHHNPLHAPLRRGAPVRVLSRYGWSHSLYLSPDYGQSYRRTPADQPWFIHLAEGTDAAARSELSQLEAAGALGRNTILIHGVGLTGADRARAIERGAALVWCPSSNFFLLGATADVRSFSKVHRLALGSDSRLTGERDLLGELRIARGTGQLGGEALIRSVTSDAAAVLKLQDIGRIAPGNRADLVILPASIQSAGQAPGRVERADLRAVVYHGAVRVGDPDLHPVMPDAAHVTLDGIEKLLASDLVERHARNQAHEPGLV
jgi:cytosine/adenosine deaminase-related metal-dependent hydrolase